MYTTKNQGLYEDGKAELILLRAARPIVSVMALAIWLYVLGGMPLPDNVSVEIAGPLRQIFPVLAIASLPALAGVWILGMFAPKDVSISKRWMVLQVTCALAVLAFVMFIFTAV